jgi:tryptophan 2,3-dioxygenase
MEITPAIQDKLEKLQQKYEALGQDLESHLEGLLNAKPLTYWDYIQLDTLLSLQKPRTDYPDEMIFIIYHQITELYFKLIQQEIRNLHTDAGGDLQAGLKYLKRINNYFRHLAESFDIMTFGMDKDQFLNFRMTLLPASGFQTAQFREIEFKMTDLYNLVAQQERAAFGADAPLSELYPYVYWKYGNLELATGKKALTLRMFEEQYDEHFWELVQAYQQSNLLQLYRQADDAIRKDPKVVHELQTLDLNVNIYWRLSHYKTAARYLKQERGEIAATGGTNWQEYLPPSFQKIYFFPELWTEEQRANWGKRWVMELFEEQIASRWSQEMKEDQEPRSQQANGED